jgi:antitoxin (DNA-binding transcriptional repressor) of toxin-antitoxin stability system
MKTVSIYEAKTNLSKLIQEVLAGEEVVIAKGKHPVVKLVVVDNHSRQRTLGRMKGKIRVAADFDDDLADFGEYQK